MIKNIKEITHLRTNSQINILTLVKILGSCRSNEFAYIFS